MFISDTFSLASNEWRDMKVRNKIIYFTCINEERSGVFINSNRAVCVRICHGNKYEEYEKHKCYKAERNHYADLASLLGNEASHIIRTSNVLSHMRSEILFLFFHSI